VAKDRYWDLAVYDGTTCRLWVRWDYKGQPHGLTIDGEYLISVAYHRHPEWETRLAAAVVDLGLNVRRLDRYRAKRVYKDLPQFVIRLIERGLVEEEFEK
jgi:hypothetical protein